MLKVASSPSLLFDNHSCSAAQQLQRKALESVASCFSCWLTDAGSSGRGISSRLLCNRSAGGGGEISSSMFYGQLQFWFKGRSASSRQFQKGNITGKFRCISISSLFETPHLCMLLPSHTLTVAPSRRSQEAGEGGGAILCCRCKDVPLA